MQSKPTVIARSEADLKPAGQGPCFNFVRTGTCESRSCLCSHDQFLARLSKGLLDLKISSPFAESFYKPKTLDVPTILSSKFAHVLYELDHEALQRILPKDVPMRYSMKPGAPLLGLSAMSQDYPSEVVPKIFPQIFPILALFLPHALLQSLLPMLGWVSCGPLLLLQYDPLKLKPAKLSWFCQSLRCPSHGPGRCCLRPYSSPSPSVTGLTDPHTLIHPTHTHIYSQIHT